MMGRFVDSAQAADSANFVPDAAAADDRYDDAAAEAATSASTTSMDPRAAMAFLSTAKISGHLLEESVTVVMEYLGLSEAIMASLGALGRCAARAGTAGAATCANDNIRGIGDEISQHVFRLEQSLNDMLTNAARRYEAIPVKVRNAIRVALVEAAGFDARRLLGQLAEMGDAADIPSDTASACAVAVAGSRSASSTPESASGYESDSSPYAYGASSPMASFSPAVEDFGSDDNGGGGYETGTIRPTSPAYMHMHAYGAEGRTTGSAIMSPHASAVGANASRKSIGEGKGSGVVSPSSASSLGSSEKGDVDQTDLVDQLVKEQEKVRQLEEEVSYLRARFGEEADGITTTKSESTPNISTCPPRAVEYWTEYMDKKSGELYYHNEKTGETTWHQIWKAQTVYQSQMTGTVQCNRPAEGVVLPEGCDIDADDYDCSKLARLRALIDWSEWEEVRDNEGRLYYHNRSTEEWSVERPPDFRLWTAHKDDDGIMGYHNEMSGCNVKERPYQDAGVVIAEDEGQVQEQLRMIQKQDHEEEAAAVSVSMYILVALCKVLF